MKNTVSQAGGCFFILPFHICYAKETHLAQNKSFGQAFSRACAIQSQVQNKSFGRAFSKARRVKGQSPLSPSADGETPLFFCFGKIGAWGKPPFVKRAAFPIFNNIRAADTLFLRPRRADILFSRVAA